MGKKAFIIFISIFALLISLYFFEKRKTHWNEVPRNSPRICKKFPKNENKKLIVFAGDSLTRGNLSFDWVNKLGKIEEITAQFELINAGINGRLANSLFLALDDIIYCKPDIIIILIGTNDAFGSIDSRGAEFYKQKWKIEESPSYFSFIQNLENIIDKLHEQTNATIAVLSIPPIGENIGSFEYKASQNFSNGIKDVSLKKGITYLPLNERIDEGLRKNKSKMNEASLMPTLYDSLFADMEKMEAHVSLDRISQSHNLTYLVDYIHLNERGAEFIGELVESFLAKDFGLYD